MLNTVSGYDAIIILSSSKYESQLNVKSENAANQKNDHTGRLWKQLITTRIYGSYNCSKGGSQQQSLQREEDDHWDVTVICVVNIHTIKE